MRGLLGLDDVNVPGVGSGTRSVGTASMSDAGGVPACTAPEGVHGLEVEAGDVVQGSGASIAAREASSRFTSLSGFKGKSTNCSERHHMHYCKS